MLSRVCQVQQVLVFVPPDVSAMAPATGEPGSTPASCLASYPQGAAASPLAHSRPRVSCAAVADGLCWSLPFNLCAARLHGISQIENAGVPYQAETPAVPGRPPDRQHALDRARLEAMLGQQTVKFLGRNKQLPVVGAPWRHAREVF